MTIEKFKEIFDGYSLRGKKAVLENIQKDREAFSDLITIDGKNPKESLEELYNYVKENVGK